MNKHLKLVLILAVMICLFSLISFKVNKISYNKHLLSKHSEYFDLDDSEKKIVDWMSLRYVKTNFNFKKDFDFEESLNVTKLKFKDYKMSLEEFCFNKKLDCDIIIENLNSNVVMGKKK